MIAPGRNNAHRDIQPMLPIINLSHTHIEHHQECDTSVGEQYQSK